jgi:hypothetical protein
MGAGVVVGAWVGAIVRFGGGVLVGTAVEGAAVVGGADVGGGAQSSSDVPF